MSETVAVEVRDGMKSYVKGVRVLNNLNMTVSKGTVYGLLGSSGCGKTSILSCIIGLRQLDSGKIVVFGREPGTDGSGIPGRRVGYMPQEAALYPFLSIGETLAFFGMIYGMSIADILKRSKFLTEFLKLPKSSKLISHLSGGQQRRASLAAAFVHDPQLLILDEPTVGLDPLLRISIWDHLCEMTKNGRTTVIVTTHYVEEARRCDKIGLMRNGRLLVENSPENLLAIFNSPLLEEIVLELCRQDHEMIKTGKGALDTDSTKEKYSINSTYSESNSRTRNDGKLVSKIPFFTNKFADYDVQSVNSDSSAVDSFNYENSVRESSSEVELFPSSRIKRIFALTMRTAAYFWRHWFFIIMVLLFPALQTTLVAVSIGGDPKNLSLAVVNNEIPDWTRSCKNSSTSLCEMGKFSCAFLSHAKKHDLDLISFPTREEALAEANLGKLYGVLTIPNNYSEYLAERVAYGMYAQNESLEGSVIKVKLDYSNYIASLLLTRQLYWSFQSYGLEIGESCLNSTTEFDLPLEYRKPVYGRLEAVYTEYVVPGALIMIVFTLPMASCGVTFVTDKRLGTWDRSTVAGVTALDIMVSMFITDGFMIFLQSLISTLIIVFGFEFKIEGSYILYGILCLLTGLCGQAYGFVLGLICPDEGSLLLTTFTLHFPFLVLGGITWPLDGVAKYMRYFSHCLPVTASLHSMRSIISRGVGFTNIRVWPGFLVLIAWIVVAWSVAIVKYKRMRR